MTNKLLQVSLPLVLSLISLNIKAEYSDSSLYKSVIQPNYKWCIRLASPWGSGDDFKNTLFTRHWAENRKESMIFIMNGGEIIGLDKYSFSTQIVGEHEFIAFKEIDVYF